MRTGNKCPVCKLGSGHLQVFPSEQFRRYQKEVTAYVNMLPQLHLYLSKPVAVAAVFYRDRAAGDLMGYLQALCDVLQHCGVILNDSLIKSLDGSRLDKDADRPRTEVLITVLKEETQETMDL